MEGARVLLLGQGAMGQAIKRLLDPRHAVKAWELDLETGEENIELEAAAEEQDFILFTLPTAPHEKLVHRIAPVVAPECVCLSIAKGLDESGRPPYAIFEAGLPAGQPRGVLYGPMIARDLREGRAGFAMLGCTDAAMYRRVVGLFAGTALGLRHSSDIAGVSWAVILKNLYVPLIGAADALELGDNVRGLLLCEILRELDEVCQSFGGRAGTAYTVAGLGDLVTSASSESSHHRRVGADLAFGRTDRAAGTGKNIRGEGIHALAMLQRHGLLDVERHAWMALMQSMLAAPEQAADQLRRNVMAWGD